MEQVAARAVPLRAEAPPADSPTEAEVLQALLAEHLDPRPRVRLHLWLERRGSLYFGAGRAQLLCNVERLGSLKKAAAAMGMSYRAAWGKLQQSERALGIKLVEARASRREGVGLTPQGRILARLYQRWFEAVEEAALAAAEEIFSFRPGRFQEQEPASPPG